MAESLGASALIFSFYFLLQASNKQSNIDYLLSGFFATWCVFLRPFMFPILILYALVLLFHRKTSQNFKTTMVKLMIFGAPFVLFEGIWVIRNYTIYNQILLTQTRLSYDNKEKYLSDKTTIKLFLGEFSSKFGGDHTFWNPKGSTYWFFNETLGTGKELFPSQIFNDSLTFNKLLYVKKLCMYIVSENADSILAAEYEKNVKETIFQFADMYKNNHPFHYFITSRIIHLKNFTLHSGVYNIPFPIVSQQTLFQKLIKAFFAIFYLSVFFIGGFYSLLLWKKLYKEPAISVFYIIPFYLIFLFPFVFKVHEFRFSTLAFPFFLISLMELMRLVMLFFKNKQKNQKNINSNS